MLATSDYGKNIQENINAVVADGNFNQPVVHRALDQKNKGVFESPIQLSITLKVAEKFDIQNPIIGNLLSQVNANKISDAKVKQLLGQAKDEELQARLDRLRKRIDKSDDDDNNNNNNINFDDRDDDNNVDGEELRRRYSNLRRPIIPSNDNNEEELFCRYNNLKAVLNNDEELLRRYNDLRTPLFRDIPPSPPLPLKRPDIEKDYDDTFLPPQTPTVEALKTDFDRPIKNLTDKVNNIIEMVPKNKKQDLDKYDMHLSEELLKLFPEVEDGQYLGQEGDQKINELPIPELTEILSKVDKGEVPKQLEFFERGQNKEFEDKVKLIGQLTYSIELLEFLQSSFCQELYIENKFKIHIDSGNIFFNNLDRNESIYSFFQQQENQSKAKIKHRHFAFTDSYKDYFEWFVHGFKGNEDQKYDLLTNKNLKYLFY